MKEFYIKTAFVILVFIAIFVIYLIYGRIDIPQQGYIEITGV